MRWKHLWLPAFLGIVLLILDIGIKRYIHNSVSFVDNVIVFQNWLGIDFVLDYALNTGIAWGMLSQYQILILCIRIGTVVGLLFYMVLGKLSFGKKTALCCIVSGAIGNIIDFFVYGHVVDMFHFIFWGYSFPVFNIADTAIFVGICYWIWLDRVSKPIREI